MKIKFFKLLALLAVLLQVMQFAHSQSVPADIYSHAKTLPHHCTVDEQIVLTCTFKHKKTMSLCASADLTKNTGSLQYRYGYVGKKPELVYPTLDRKSRPNPSVDRPLAPFNLGDIGIRNDINKNAKADPLNPWHQSRQWSTQKPVLGEVKYVSIYFYPIPSDKKVEFQITSAIANPFSFEERVYLLIVRSKSGTRLVKEGSTRIGGDICIANRSFENLKMLENDLEGE